jgi:hypothetical protein
MTDARFDVALGLLAVSLAVFAVQRTREANSLGKVPAPVIARASAFPPVTNSDSVSDAEAALVENDMFRLANRPASVLFTLVPVPEAPNPRAVTMAEPRPNLILRAIVGGPPWLAVLDGVPTQPKSLTVRAGDTFGKLVIKSVERDTVVVQMSDSTWKLTISRGA